MLARLPARPGPAVRTALLAGLALLARAAPAAAQGEAGPWRVSLEVGAEAGALPRSLLDACTADPDGGLHPAVGGGLGLALARGALSLGVRSTAVSTPLVEPPCTREHESGVHESRRPAFDPGDHLASEIRLRLALPFAPRWSVHAGGGTLWPHDVTLYTAGVGYLPRLPAPGRVLRVEAGWTRYRVPVRVSVQEWEGFRPVRELSRESLQRWEDGFTVRAGLSFPLR